MADILVKNVKKMIEHPKHSEGQQKIFVDIDETICFYPEKRSYELAVPSKENINKINTLYDKGYHITYYTARGTVTKINYYELTKMQLDSWGCKYHNLITGEKPAWDLIIDDKSLRIEEL